MLLSLPKSGNNLHEYFKTIRTQNFYQEVFLIVKKKSNPKNLKNTKKLSDFRKFLKKKSEKKSDGCIQFR